MGKPRSSGTVCGDNWSPPSGWMGTQAMGGKQLLHLKNVMRITAPDSLQGADSARLYGGTRRKVSAQVRQEKRKWEQEATSEQRKRMGL
jgi:hypothetical protein